MRWKTVMRIISLMLLINLVMPLKEVYSQMPVKSSANSPPNQYELVKDTFLGGGPVTVDPARCYDTTSAELIFNVYETLIFFDGEQYDIFMPQLATQVTVEPPNTVWPDVNTGRVAPSYTNFTVDFKIRIGVPFQNRCRTDDGAATWGRFFLTTEDVGYTFQRFLVHDYVGAATWIWLEPLLDCHATPSPTDAAPYDLASWGTKMQDAVQWNATDVWINCANPGLTPATGTVSFAPIKMFSNDFGNGTFRAEDMAGYPSPNGFFNDCAVLPLDYPLSILMQVVSQSWCSILSRGWILNYVIPNGPDMNPDVPGKQVDWDGDFAYWADYTGWSESALDKIPIGATHPATMCGTGPYMLDRYDPTLEWSVVKNDAYWRGWPAQWPSPPYPPYPSSGIKPAGYVTRLTVRQNTTAQRITDLLTGECDFANLPSSRAGDLHASGNRNGPTLSGIRLNYPIPTLQVESCHYTFITNPRPLNDYGTIYPNNTLGANGVPANFFNVSDVRLAMTYLQNFTYAIQTLFYGEAYQPHTCAPDGLPYVNLTETRYPSTPNLSAAKALLETVSFGPNANQKLTNVGCDIPVCYYLTGGAMEAYCINFANEINLVGALSGGGIVKAHIVYIAWNDFMPAMDTSECAIFRAGWLADYADVHDFLFPYGDSKGTFGAAQRFVDPTLDNLLAEAVRTPDGPARQALYYQAEDELYKLNPTTFIMVPIERGYMRAWVQGHYYNPWYPGIYAYNHWKAEEIRGDVNHDGVVNTLDLCAICGALASYIGKGGMPVISPWWNFHCDVDGNPYESDPPGDGGWRDRKIDMYDVGAALTDFGQGTPPEPPPPGGNIYLAAEPSKETVAIGYNVNVTVKINNADNLTAFEIHLLYNATLLKLVKCQIEPLPDGWWSTGIGRFALYALSLSGNTTLVTFIFEGLANGNTTLDISTSVLAAGWSVQPMPYNPINGSVRVVLAGDVDENGRADMGDISSLCDGFGATMGADGNYWHHPPGILDPFSPNLDIDSNGRVDMGDIVTALGNFGQHYP